MQRDGETFDAYAEALTHQAVRVYPDLTEEA